MAKIRVRFIIDIASLDGPYYASARLGDGRYIATRAGGLVEGRYPPEARIRVFGNYVERETDMEIEVRDGPKPRPLSRLPLN